MVTSAITKASLMAATGVAIGALGLALAEPAHALSFTGSYTPDQFTLTNTNADGSVGTFVNGSGAPVPGSIFIIGGNNGNGAFGSTRLFTTAAAAGFVSFDWTYESQDSSSNPRLDPFGFYLNGVFNQLTLDQIASDAQFGTSSFNVAAGDSFGFEIQTTNNLGGFAFAIISNFSAPEPVSTPEPIPTPALLPGLVGLGVAALRKRKGEALAETSEQT